MPQINYYAGIGSRKTPDNEQVLMMLIALRLQACRYVLRTGGAKGADEAFARKVQLVETYRPKVVYEDILAPNPLEEEIAAAHHPNWPACTPYAKALHRRNVQIILGDVLNEPADFVICWTPDGRDTGGTGLGIRIARTYGIPVHNLHDTNTFNKFVEWLNSGPPFSRTNHVPNTE